MLRYLQAPLVAGLALLSQETQGQKINWGPCTGLNGTASILCGNLTVPLDYTEPNSNATLRLELLKVAATNAPSKGSILFNFGGPGIASRKSLASQATYLLNVTGGNHDLVTFDPRGTGNTLTFSCYKTDAERFIAGLMGRGTTNSSNTAVGTLWAMGEGLANLCAENLGNIGGLVGTAFVARDMMRVVDALDEDSLLRYWGISYGSILGATVAAMFPDRMDKVIIDGVVNPHQYYHDWDSDMLLDTDKTFDALLNECAASPSSCILARNGATGPQLRSAIDKALSTLKFNPLPLGAAIIEYAAMKPLILACLKAPSLYPMMISGLDGLVTSNTTAISDFFTNVANILGGLIDSDALQGIRCGEKTFRVSRHEDLQPAINRLHNISKIAGDTFGSILMPCSQWKTNAKEVYTGNFQVRTRKPLLVIGNTFDPITPLASARNVSAGFEGSVVLEQRGFGHTSMAQRVACTESFIRGYFADGTLPKPGTVCESTSPLFVPKAVQPSKRARRAVGGEAVDESEMDLQAAKSLDKMLLRMFWK